MSLISSRFFLDNQIRALERVILKDFGHADEQIMLFPSAAVAARCIDFLEKVDAPTGLNIVAMTISADRSAQTKDTRLITFIFHTGDTVTSIAQNRSLLSAAIFHERFAQAAKSFWQHTGDGISSRRAELCYELYQKGCIEAQAIFPIDGLTASTLRGGRGPRRYQKLDADTKFGKPNTGLGMRQTSLTF